MNESYKSTKTYIKENMKNSQLYWAFAKISGALSVLLMLAGCPSAADTASNNLSTAADNFEILRTIRSYNAIQDIDVFTVTGFCSLGNYDKAGWVTVTCLIGEDENGDDEVYKHFLGLSDNVSVIAEQIDGATVSKFHHRFQWRPQTAIPNIDLQGDTDELSRDIEPKKSE